MQVTDKLTKALTEAKYLNADNVSRYRCIMRIFFENYEKLRYWLYQMPRWYRIRFLRITSRSSASRIWQCL